MVPKFLAAVTGILMSAVFNASAAVVYSYTGNNYTSADDPYTAAMNITLQFSTAAPLATTGEEVTSEILSYTIFDGRTTLTEADSESLFVVNIDAVTGLPIEWSIGATNEFGVPIGDIINRMSTIYFVSSGGIDRTEEGECRVVPAGTGECMGLANLIFADVKNSPGSWSVVPVPAAAWLFVSGLVGLTALHRRKRFS